MPGGRSSGLTSGVQMWDTATFERTRVLETSAMPWGVAFSPDGLTLAVATWEGSVDVIDVSTGARRATLPAHQRLASTVAFSPDGALLATGSEDGSVRLWDAASLRPLLSLETNSGIVAQVAFDPGSRYVSAACEGRALLVYDLHAMRPFIEGHRAVQEARFMAREYTAQNPPASPPAPAPPPGDEPGALNAPRHRHAACCSSGRCRGAAAPGL